MKWLLWLSALLLAYPLPAQDIRLPTPQKSGGLPLLEALARRATARAFDSRELTSQQLSTLLWSCFGINRADGKRTAPSAHNEQASALYVLLKEGAYLYDAQENSLRLIVRGDLRKFGATQDFATNAPVTLVLVADLAKMTNETGSASLEMANLNAGYISQNAYLYCASEGLVTGARVSVNRKALSPKLKLRPDELILLAHSVGYPKSSQK